MARLVIISGIVIVIAAAALLMSENKNGCSVSAIGGSGERIYLPTGTIYAWTDDPDRTYRTVDQSSVHVTGDQLERMVCFESEKEAEEAGYAHAVLLDVAH